MAEASPVPLYPKPPRKVKALGRNWLSKAWKDAQTKLAAVDPELPADVDGSVKDRSGPVERARGLAELAAPGDMKLLIAIRHGLSPEQIETYGKALRLTVDGAQRSLSMVGLKSAEAVEHDMSDRLRGFLELWHSDRGAPVDVTPRPELPPAAPGDP